MHAREGNIKNFKRGQTFEIHITKLFDVIDRVGRAN